MESSAHTQGWISWGFLFYYRLWCCGYSPIRSKSCWGTEGLLSWYSSQALGPPWKDRNTTLFLGGMLNQWRKVLKIQYSCSSASMALSKMKWISSVIKNLRHLQGIPNWTTMRTNKLLRWFANIKGKSAFFIQLNLPFSQQWKKHYLKTFSGKYMTRYSRVVEKPPN